MILHTYYKDATGLKVYLEEVINSIAFYRIGSELITATEEFFINKYRLNDIRSK